MGAEITKWLVDSKVEELHKNMPWKDNEKKESQADSIADEFARRAGDVFGQTEEGPDEGTQTAFLSFCSCSHDAH
jgi:hypothetical protein